MNKVLAVTMLSLFSVSCMALERSGTISIENKTDTKVTVRDSDNHTVTVGPNRSSSLAVIFREPYGSFPIPSLLLPFITTITVTDDKGSNTIEVNELNKKIIISEGLALSKE